MKLSRTVSAFFKRSVGKFLQYFFNVSACCTLVLIDRHNIKNPLIKTISPPTHCQSGNFDFKFKNIYSNYSSVVKLGHRFCKIGRNRIGSVSKLLQGGSPFIVKTKRIFYTGNLNIAQNFMGNFMHPPFLGYLFFCRRFKLLKKFTETNNMN